MSRPVDLNIGNSIINAFAQGRAEALERLRNKQVQDQLAVENERAIERQKIQDEQFKAQLAQQKLEAEARQKLDELGYQLRKTGTKIDIDQVLRKQIQEGGIPSGYSQETLPYLDEAVRQMPTIPGATSPLGEPAFEQELVKFKRQAEDPLDIFPKDITERNPAAARREQTVAAQQEEIRKFRLAQQAADAAQARELETKALEGQLPLSVEKKAELDQALLIARENNNRALEIARLNAKQSGIGLGSLAQAYLQNPDLAYDSTIGTPKTRGEAIAELASLGYNIKSNQQKIVQELAPRTLTLVKDILDDKNFTWGVSSLLKVIPGTKSFDDESKVQALLAALTVPEIKHIKNLGAMSDADREFITNISTELEHGLSPARGNAVLNRLKTIYEKAVKAEAPLITPNRKPLSSFE